MTDSPDQNRVPGLPLRDLAGFAHRWVDAEGIRLHAVEGGRSSGPTVVLLAGFPQTWWAWHKGMPRLEACDHDLRRCNNPALELVISKASRPAIEDLHYVGAGLHLA